MIAIGVPAMAVAAAPSNDNFADGALAAFPAEGATYVGTNVDATVEPGEPNHAASPFAEPFHSIWYSWTPTTSGTAKIETCGSAFNTRLAVYTGTAVDALTEVASNDDAANGATCGNSKFSEVTFAATAGTTYRIAVDTNGDLAGDGSGPPFGEVKLTVHPVAADGGGNGGGGETETTTPGTPLSVEDTRVTVSMPAFEPVKGKDGKYSFTKWATVNKELSKLQEQGLNFRLTAKHKPLHRMPSRFRDTIRKNPDGGGQVIDTRPRPGTQLSSTADEQVAIVVVYWNPALDSRYAAEVERKAQEELKRRADEQRRQEEEKKRKEQEKNRCQLFNLDDNKIKELVGNAGYYGGYQGAAKFVRSYKNCKAAIFKSEDANYTQIEFVREMRFDKKFSDKNIADNTIEMSVVRPKAPDFVLVFREDPARVENKDEMSLVPTGRGDWVLPTNDENLSSLTVQVIERATGRLASNVAVSVLDANTGKRLGQVETDGNGERNIAFSPRPGQTSLVFTAHYGKGANQMSATRQIEVKNLGAEFTTVCGRKFTRKTSNGRTSYTGRQADLDSCRGIDVVPGNLGHGSGTSAPRNATVEQTEAISVQPNGTLATGTHNSISIRGDNTIVAVAPGLVAPGSSLIGQAGGNVIGTGGLNRPRTASLNFGPIGQFFSWVVSGLTRASNQNLSNTNAALGPAAQAKIKKTAAALEKQGVAPPPAQELTPKAVGVISVGGGNLIGQAGGNVISVGGGNVISTGGFNRAGAAGARAATTAGIPAGTVIAAGDANLMPVYGGQAISTG